MVEKYLVWMVIFFGITVETMAGIDITKKGDYKSFAFGDSTQIVAEKGRVLEASLEVSNFQVGEGEAKCFSSLLGVDVFISLEFYQDRLAEIFIIPTREILSKEDIISITARLEQRLTDRYGPPATNYTAKDITVVDHSVFIPVTDWIMDEKTVLLTLVHNLEKKTFRFIYLSKSNYYTRAAIAEADDLETTIRTKDFKKAL